MPTQKITDQNIGNFKTIYENYQVNPAFYENHEQSAELLNAVSLYEEYLDTQRISELPITPGKTDLPADATFTPTEDSVPTYKPSQLKSLDVEMPDTFDIGSLGDLVKSQEDSLVSINSQLPGHENKLKELDKKIGVLDVSQQIGDTKKLDSIKVRINEIKNRFTEIENINSEDLNNDQIDEINTEIAFLNNENKELYQQYTELATVYNKGIEKKKEQDIKVGDLIKQYNETLTEYQDLINSHNSIIGRLETNVNRHNALIETGKGKVIPKVPVDDMGFIEDAKLLYKALSTGISGGMENVPGVIARSIEGGNVDAVDEGKIANVINKSDLKQKMLALQGPEAQEKIFNLFTAGDIQQTLFQIPYSLTAMAATMGGKGLTTLLLRGGSKGFVGLASSAVALLAGGGFAYSATKNQFMRDQRDLMYQLTPDATEEMWENWKQAIAGSAHKYAMWEAVPEAVGNLLLAKLYMLPAAKLFPVIANIESTVARKLASAFTKYSLTLAEEIPTETITQLGQGRIEALTGLRDQVSESTWEEIKRSLGEILPQTIMTSAILAGAGGVISGTVEQFKGEKTESAFEEKKIPVGVAEQKIISEVIEGVDEKPKAEPVVKKPIEKPKKKEVKPPVKEDISEKITEPIPSEVKKEPVTETDFDKSGDLTDKGFTKAQDILKAAINDVAEQIGLPSDVLLEHYGFSKSGKYSRSEPILDIGESTKYNELIDLIKKTAIKLNPEQSDKIISTVNKYSQDQIDALERGDVGFEVPKEVIRIIDALEKINEQYRGAIAKELPQPAPIKPKVPKAEEIAAKAKLGAEKTIIAVPKKDIKRTNIPITEIGVDLSEFQGRRKPYSQKSVDRIIKAVDEGTFDWVQFEDILLWKDKDGKLTVLAGHSRLEAAKQLVEKGHDEFKELPSRIIEGTKEEAAEKAKMSNILATAETLLDGAHQFRKKRAAGMNKTQLLEEAKKVAGKNAATVLALSHLSKNGSVEQALEAFEDVSTKDARDVLSMATWIGKVREKFPELTRSHETEMFTYLQKTFNVKFKRSEEFINTVSVIVDRHTEFGKFDGKPLNFKDVISVSKAELEYNKLKEEANKNVSDATRELSAKRKELSQIKGATKKEISEVLMDYEQRAVAAEMELTKIMERDAQTKSNLRKQASIFDSITDLAENTKNALPDQDISKKEKAEYKKALDKLTDTIKDESGFILVGMIPKLSTFIKSKKKDGILTKKEVDSLNEKLKRDYTFKNEKFESEYQTDKSKDTHTLWGGITNFFEDVAHKTTREFEHLPKSKKFAEVSFILRMAQKQKGIASYKASKNISTIVDNLKRGDFNLFSRKVLLDDLAESANRDEPLPRDWDVDMVKEELSRIDSKIEGNEKVQEALDGRKEYWDILKKDYIDAMKLVGKNIKGMDRESYFRHLVLDYADAENYLGTYNKLKTPAGQSFLKKRVGSIRPIRTDYVMAEYDVIVRMVHDIGVANIINAIKSRADIKNEVQDDTKEGEDWHKNIPDGYSIWQPEQGNFFFFANTIPDNIATDLLEGFLEEAKITKDQIKKVLAIGGRKQEMVLPNEVIETLNNLNPPKSKNWVSNTFRWVTRQWKIWTLISPRRYLRYNLRNMTGDAEAAFVGNMSSFKKAPQAIKELYAAFTGKKTMTDQLQDYFEMGGFEATLQSQEIKPVDELRPLITVNKNIFKKTWNGYWKAAKGSTDFRESILRYANYIDYLGQLEKGKLKNYGASMKAEVDALGSNKMKAYMLANDLIGAYDRVGVAGQSFRELLYPFWSWQEVNFKRYIRFVQNAADSDQLAGAIGRKLGAKTVFTALKVGKYAIKATGLWTMLVLWNNLMFPDEEEELSEQERNTPHIIFGRDKNGEIISFNRLGTLGDFVEWFGLDAAPANVAAYLKNRKTIKEISIEMLQSPVNKFAQGINPIIKAAPEFMDRKSWFPDVFNRYTIRDRGVHLARSLGLENEYKAVTGKPSKKYAETLKNLAIYTTNPGQVAYSKNYTTKNKFLKKKKIVGYFQTDKGDAIYNYKTAIRYKDAKAAAKYYLDYYILMKIANPELSDKDFEKLVAKDMSKALVNMHPMSGLSRKKGVDLLYIAQLNFEEKLVLAKAINYYEETLLRTADKKFAIEMNKEMAKLLK